ncbi:stage V sporulation protein AA [Bacillus andreraoultii]|uniref:stage V sporulation protein AA n=1 Tax=Bacillus andreraoultii TaxID=1499685 RepID=UPI00053B3FA1|nr:stage V sporulation protein AA [Bacillus andreraoultii]
MDTTIYIRLRHRVQVGGDKPVYLKDIASINAPDVIIHDLKKLIVHKVTKEDNNIIIIDGIQIIEVITDKLNIRDIQLIGPQQTIVEVVMRKVKMSIPLFLLVWLLLFIGSAISIMNFHEDVSMQVVHQKLFYLLTGIKDEKPLTIQIPYSIGLGLGMILFFNHVFKKRINDEPSPLEVEMFNYQQSLDQYVIMNENKESMKRMDE